MDITIFHRIGQDLFIESAQTLQYEDGKVEFELAYTYKTHRNSLEEIWRDNNAVDGSEINVKLEKRSLSVGDVVGIGDYNPFSGHNLSEVASLGYTPVTDLRVKHALILARRSGVSA